MLRNLAISRVILGVVYSCCSIINEIPKCRTPVAKGFNFYGTWTRMGPAMTIKLWRRVRKRSKKRPLPTYILAVICRTSTKAKFILDPHPKGKPKIYCTPTRIIDSSIYFLFTLLIRMRIEYELGLRREKL